MAERMIDIGTAELCVETFGERERPAVLLIAGAASSMLSWADGFCERLAAAGHHVIRYDQRDTGRSTCDPPGKPSYADSDLVAETVALLDALELPKAHLFGMSMGGGITQQVALDHPDRVESIILTGSTPGGPGPSYDDLPRPAPVIMASFAEEQTEPDWTDRDAVINWVMEAERPYAGSAGFDEAAWRDIASRTYDRARSIASLNNHFLAGGGPPWRHRLGSLRTPTLVLHGADDPFFPGHGEFLAREIPGAELIMLDGVGHETPPRFTWDRVVSEIGRRTGARPD
ncbi:alpha/beta fold hydrolase [Microlunatus sp. GCM10028923]|uniref:alpha/beta fold hydrolase n=1 Tax=Microlunatus sp. GCM10028923 TaxID=3273400 RepID=UPI00360B9DA5